MNNQQLRQLELFIAKRDFAEAEKLCLELQGSQNVDDSLILRALVHVYMQTGQINLAIDLLKPHFKSDPANRFFCDTLAELYRNVQDFDSAAECYARHLKFNINEPEALYNLAFNLRHAGEFEKAISHYNMALRYNVNMPEEVLLNIAVIYSDHLVDDVRAKSSLLKALKINPNYTPAIFNLANLYEQSGDLNQATSLFEKVLLIEPNQFKALARLADLRRFSSKEDPIIIKILSVLGDKYLDQSTKIDLLFGLGKAYNDCKEFRLAFNYYEMANKENALEYKSYKPEEFELYVQKIIRFFSKDWVSSHSTGSEHCPVFICGMFRSGSTLIEQILASHPKITAGGELEFFVRKVGIELVPFPEKLNLQTAQAFEDMAEEYETYIKERFHDTEIITDKRPDNIFYLGLIFCLFPNAKVIFTERNSLDNFLSVFFQRLGQSMNYATNLQHIEHYHLQVQKLILHWRELFGDSIHTVNYDEMIERPKENVTEVLSFLGLGWDDDCLNFHQLKNKVKTASVWQVRQPLYSSSSGRWQNYQNELGDLLPHKR